MSKQNILDWNIRTSESTHATLHDSRREGEDTRLAEQATNEIPMILWSGP